MPTPSLPRRGRTTVALAFLAVLTVAGCSSAPEEVEYTEEVESSPSPKVLDPFVVKIEDAGTLGEVIHLDHWDLTVESLNSGAEVTAGWDEYWSLGEEDLDPGTEATVVEDDYLDDGTSLAVQEGEQVVSLSYSLVRTAAASTGFTWWDFELYNSEGVHLSKVVIPASEDANNEKPEDGIALGGRVDGEAFLKIKASDFEAGGLVAEIQIREPIGDYSRTRIDSAFIKVQ